MKRIFLIILIILLKLQITQAQEHRIKFNLKFGFVKGGEAEMVIKDTIFNERPAICYYMIGKTTGLANALYGVHDIYETIVDAESHLPLKTIRNVHEGSYTSFNETFFYHDTDSIKSLLSGWRKVPDNLLDIISVFYYFLYENPFKNMQPGDAVTYPTYHADEITQVQVKFLRHEKIKTKIGDINCNVLNPSLDKGKVLNSANGVYFYISEKKKLPVLIVLDMKVGALKGVIRSYTIDGVVQTSW